MSPTTVVALVAAAGIVAALVWLVLWARRAGRDGQRLDDADRSNRTQKEMLDAAADRPADAAAVAGRMRSGDF